MIEVVTSRNALLYQDALEDAYRCRNDLLVPALTDSRQVGVDRFDTADAVHLLLTRDDGVVIAALRLLSTVGPHGLSEIAPELCAVRGLQRGPAIWELNASGADATILDRAARARAANRLLVGLFEFCVRADCENLTMLLPTDKLFQLLLIGLRIKPLGLPVERDDLRQVAVMVTVDRAAFDVLRLALHVPGQQVVYVGAPSGDALVLRPLDEDEQSSAAA